MEDPNILDIDSHVFMEIETMLENKSTRDNFLRSIPSSIFTPTSIQLMDNESYKHYMSTGKWLLFHLGNKGVRVSEFVRWLEEAKLEKALMLLKKDVPIKIIKEPPSIVHVQSGATLSVTCKATSFPSPEYQWFKEDEELLLQQNETLLIEHIKEEDSGLYICLVAKPNLDPNSDPWSYTYSNLVQIEVSEVSSQNCLFTGHSISTPSSISDSLSPEDSLISISDNLKTLPLSENQKRAAKIKSKVHPLDGKIPQGASIILHCRAKYIKSDPKLPKQSSNNIQYQWYKNGRPIEGATYCDLPLNYLYPDPVTGDMKWQYYCLAFDDYDREFSNTVEVELEEEKDSTTYYATGKYAFMIANDTYANLQHLKKPARDISDLAILLEEMDFEVYAYRNLNLAEIKNAFKNFYTKLEPGCYVLFYFAGHAFEQFGQVYLQPVDCSEKYDPLKAVCAEEILQCLQTAKPALNVFLIDACRKLPDHIRNGEKLTLNVQEAENFKIFDGKMGRNTIFGYSTPFLYSAYECDSEPNSFFVKNLKKHITKNKRINDILDLVQQDFMKEEKVKNRQFPEIRTTLSGNRKLCDEIKKCTNKSLDLDFTLKKFRENLAPSPTEIPLSSAGSTIIIKASPYLDVFMNDIDILVSIFINMKAPLNILDEMEIDLISADEEKIKLLPATSVCLRNIEKKPSENNFLLKKQAFGIQKFQGETIDCKLLIKFPRAKKCIEASVKINVKSITDLKLFVNHLGTLIIEGNSL